MNFIVASTVWEVMKISVSQKAIVLLKFLRQTCPHWAGSKIKAQARADMQQVVDHLRKSAEWQRLIISFSKTKVMNQLALSEPYTHLQPVIGGTKLKAVTERCYLCRRLSSVASQVENRIREVSRCLWQASRMWHWGGTQRHDVITPSVAKLPSTTFRSSEE